jgi:hypothetical protein
MKILKEKSRVYKEKIYYKYKINIPENILVQSKLKVGDELDVNIENEKLTLIKKRS